METSPRLRYLTLAAVLAAMLAFPTCGSNELSAPTSPTALLPGATASRSLDGKIALTDEVLAEPSALGAAEVGTLALSITPSVFRGGDSTRGTVTFAVPATEGGMEIALASDDTAASVPASITIAHGGTSGSFTITTREVPADVRIRITASAGGDSLTALIRLTPVSRLSLSVSPRIVRGGDSTTGTVTLNSTFPAGGTLVTLSSSRADARVPASITIPQGSTRGTFTIETSGVSYDTEVDITASTAAMNHDTTSVQIRLTSGISSTTGTVAIGGKVK